MSNQREDILTTGGDERPVRTYWWAPSSMLTPEAGAITAFTLAVISTLGFGSWTLLTQSVLGAPTGQDDIRGQNLLRRDSAGHGARRDPARRRSPPRRCGSGIELGQPVGPCGGRRRGIRRAALRRDDHRHSAAAFSRRILTIPPATTAPECDSAVLPRPTTSATRPAPSASTSAYQPARRSRSRYRCTPRRSTAALPTLPAAALHCCPLSQQIPGDATRPRRLPVGSVRPSVRAVGAFLVQRLHRPGARRTRVLARRPVGGVASAPLPALLRWRARFRAPATRT